MVITDRQKFQGSIRARVWVSFRHEKRPEFFDCKEYKECVIFYWIFDVIVAALWFYHHRWKKRRLLASNYVHLSLSRNKVDDGRLWVAERHEMWAGDRCGRRTETVRWISVDWPFKGRFVLHETSTSRQNVHSGSDETWPNVRCYPFSWTLPWQTILDIFYVDAFYNAKRSWTYQISPGPFAVCGSVRRSTLKTAPYSLP